MQAKFERGKAAFHGRSLGWSAAIVVGGPLITALALCAPERALAACGTASHPTGLHAAASGEGGMHVATSRPAAPGGASGCSTGVNTSALRGLPTASSGRVVEPGAHAARTEGHARNTPTKTTNAGAHLRAVTSPHHA